LISVKSALTPPWHDAAMKKPCPDQVPLAPVAGLESSRAVARIKMEHRAIARVIGAMQTWISRCREQGQVDTDLFASMLRYVKDVPHALHHPREDEVLFPMLASHARVSVILDELNAEHARVDGLLESIDVAFRDLKRDMPNALNALAIAVEDFAEFYWAHMRKEEEELLPIASAVLSEGQWSSVARAFCETDDPLFRADVAAEYRRLYEHIAAASPTDLRAYLFEAA
jgi:hemerythrin-like domain-containing protein